MKLHNRLAQKSNTVSIGFSVAIIFFFLFDILAFLWVAKELLHVSSAADPDTLEFRNPYIGLDDLYKYHPDIKRLPYERIVNEPKIATQVSPEEPGKVFPVDLHQWLSDFGVLSPPDRRLHVTESVCRVYLPLDMA